MGLFASARRVISMRRDPVAYARSIGVTVGDRARILSKNPSMFGSEPYLISIGDHVTLTDVRFVTHDGGVWVLRDDHPDIDVLGRITIHDNCFIGLGAIILPGVEIGPNSIVAAGAVVNKDVPPNSVAAGVGAKVVSTLDEYRERSLSKAMHVKSLSPGEKRRAIETNLDRSARP